MIKVLEEVLTNNEFVNIVKEKYPNESDSVIGQTFDEFSNHCVFIADDLSDFSYSYSGKTFLAKKIEGIKDGVFTEDQLKNLVAIHAFEFRDKPYERKAKHKKEKDMELIHVSAFLKEKPAEAKNDMITLFAEAWRDSNTKKSHPVKISLSTDLYLDCLSVSQGVEEEIYLSFATTDSWKDLKKVFKRPSFAFLLEDGFDLLVEEEKDMKILKEF